MKTSESGYEKNLSLFQQMLNEVINQGTNYTPPIAALSIENLQSRVAPVKISLDKVQSCLTDYTFAVNNRQEAYESMKTLVKKINNLLSLFDFDSRFMTDIKSVYDKIMGYSSNSLQGFEHQEENFKAFISLLEKQETYQSNEPDQSIESLEQFADELENKSLAVSTANAALAAARDERNQLMYNSETGLVPLSRKVKQYFKSRRDSKGEVYQRLVNLLSAMR